jgi:hypothetical protein
MPPAARNLFHLKTHLKANSARLRQQWLDPDSRSRTKASGVNACLSVKVPRALHFICSCPHRENADSRTAEYTRRRLITPGLQVSTAYPYYLDRHLAPFLLFGIATRTGFSLSSAVILNVNVNRHPARAASTVFY